jgi:hypothetical protein
VASRAATVPSALATADAWSQMQSLANAVHASHHATDTINDNGFAMFLAGISGADPYADSAIACAVPA